MIDASYLIRLADAYKAGAAVPNDSTVSFRVFGDSKKLAQLREGRDITVGRFNLAVAWFRENWPDGIAWPEPETKEAAE